MILPMDDGRFIIASLSEKLHLHIKIRLVPYHGTAETDALAR